MTTVAERLEPSAEEAPEFGMRAPSGIAGSAIFWLALCWSLFQIYIASPLPYELGGVFLINSEQARLVHYAFAIALGFMLYPGSRRASRDRVPLHDIGLAVVGAASALYMFVFYYELSRRVAAPEPQDVAVAVIGTLVLLEAVRRAVSLALVIVALIFFVYIFAGAYMPDMIAHPGASLNRAADHMWLGREGIFGFTLDISTTTVFLFVLFGAMLERAGAGGWFIRLSFALLGAFRGGPAKAAVVASAAMGIISGSALANVVTTGTLTIPLMKKVGFTPEKAAAIESTSSINGQLMPPVMGAAAFMLAEFVGISYREVIMHALLPAVISYIGLFYVVHLEATKNDMPMLGRAMQIAPLRWLTSALLTFMGFVLVGAALYFGFGWMKAAFGDATIYGAALVFAICYLGLLRLSTTVEEHDDNVDLMDGDLPDVRSTAISGLYFLLPLILLMWCLMVERLSTSYSIYWTIVSMTFVMVTHRPVKSWIRGESSLAEPFVQGLRDLVSSLEAGARNMVSIAIALAAAGIVVGAVSLTGIGLAMVNIISTLSGGNLILMLVLTAIITIILGMGLPTTANYVVVASIMAPVIVVVAGQNGMMVPLIAAHMFVFYQGLLAGNTPPVAVDAYAAAGLARCSPMRTCLQAFYYSLRMMILPFLFVFNPQLLLVGIDNLLQILLISVMAIVAMLAFVAASQGWFLVRSRRLESAALLLVAFSLMLPGFWLNRIYPPFAEIPVTTIAEQVSHAPDGAILKLDLEGEDFSGVEVARTAALQLGAQGAEGLQRLYDEAGLALVPSDGGGMVVDNVAWGSAANKAGIDFDWNVTSAAIQNAQPSKYWVYIPALLLLAMVVFVQLGRRRETQRLPVAAQ